MRSIGGLGLLVLLVACGGDDCPGISLEMREHRGEDVEGVDIWCDGEFYDPRWSSMCRSGGAYVGDTPAECSGTTINIARNFFLGFFPRLVFAEVDGELIARGYVDYDDDVIDGSPPRLPHVLVGAVAPQEHGENGRYRGRFELLVNLNGDRGHIRGTYDTTNIVDEGEGARRSCYEER